MRRLVCQGKLVTCSCGEMGFDFGILRLEKNHVPKSARFKPLSLIRTNLPISRLIFAILKADEPNFLPERFFQGIFSGAWV
jgi:hypothetical protein